jgi:hypothetical protein
MDDITSPISSKRQTRCKDSKFPERETINLISDFSGARFVPVVKKLSFKHHLGMIKKPPAQYKISATINSHRTSLPTNWKNLSTERGDLTKVENTARSINSDDCSDKTLKQENSRDESTHPLFGALISPFNS